jgi:hypothetical protein
MPTFKASDYGPALPDDQALLCEIRDYETTKQNPKFVPEGEQPKDQLKIQFEVIEGEFEGAKFTAWVNATFGPKSTLKALAAAALGVEVDDVEDFDTDDLLDKRLLVVGDHGKDGKAEFWRPRKYKAAGSGGARARRQESAKAAEQPATRSARARKSEPAAVGANGRADGDSGDLDF